MQDANSISIVDPHIGQEIGTLGCARPGALTWKPAHSDEAVDFPSERLRSWLHSLLGSCDNVPATVRLCPSPSPSGMDPIKISERSPLPRASGAAMGVRWRQR